MQKQKDDQSKNITAGNQTKNTNAKKVNEKPKGKGEDENADDGAQVSNEDVNKKTK